MKKRGLISLALVITIIGLISFNVFAEKNNEIEKSPLDFSLFASENILISGSEININGGIWVNNNLAFNGDSFDINGDTWSSNDIKSKGTIDGLWPNKYSNLNIQGNINKVSSPMSMIDIMSEIEDVAMENAIIYEGNKTINDTDLDSSSIIIKGGSASGIFFKRLNNYIIADDKISISVLNDKSSIDKPIVIASKKDTYTPYDLSLYESSISIDGSSIAIVGNIYAPNGNVKIRGSGIYIIGNIIARNIYLEAAGIYINDKNEIDFEEDL